MSDTPSDTSGQEEPGPYVPAGPRRSTYTPPPSSDVWDDDALAAALEEQVRTYTAPITLPDLSNVPPGRAAEPVPASEPASSAAEPAPTEPPAAQETVRPFSWDAPAASPAVAAAVPGSPVPADAPAPDHIAVDPFTPPPVDDDELLREVDGVSTEHAIERLEQELHRRAVATGQIPIAPAVAPFFRGEPPVSPPAPGPDPAPEESAAASAGVAPAGDESPAPAEASDPWRAAPPPSFAPPILIESPPVELAEPTPEPAPRLLPPPTDLPDVAHRAELPPPPGYTDDGSPVPLDPWQQLLAAAPTAVSVAAPSADEENDDAVDDGDRVRFDDTSPVAVTPTLSAPAPIEPAFGEPSPPEPSASPEFEPEPDAASEPVDLVAPPTPASVLAVETTGPAPTPVERRVGRAARLFWLWFAANASVVSVALGAVMIGMGMSLRQAIVAIVVGVALSFIPLGFTTLAGKWNAQPTLVLSRAAFGVTGNVLPTVLAVLVRVFWGGALLWLLGDAVGRTLVEEGVDAGFGATRWAIIAMAVALLLTGLVAAVGYGLLARVQLVLSIVAGVLVVVAAIATLPRVDLGAALRHQDGSWILVVGGGVLVFSFIGLVWAFSGSDLARYQNPGGSGASSMLWATFGATIPPFLLIAWGALLAASDPRLASGLATHPFQAIIGAVPAWAIIPLLLAAVVGLLSGTALSIYSGGFAMQNLTPRLPRITGVIVAALLSLVLGAVFVLLDAQARTIVTDLAVTLAVPGAAWTGIFAAEIMIRQRRFHPASLLARGGVYPDVRWPNLIGLVVISVIGYAFISGTTAWLGWEGFGWRLLGVRSGDPLAAADLGVAIALLLGIVLPLVSAVPAIRRQESATPVAVGGAVAART
ncbi:cytosine permease [Pseudolysinimonas sp.]|uniref:purine-cytosine permease family protein n=1 Tax=Pseudolysinimonas sp. TaxID=2680009 RepID=UPI003F7ED852